MRRPLFRDSYGGDKESVLTEKYLPQQTDNPTMKAQQWIPVHCAIAKRIHSSQKHWVVGPFSQALRSKLTKSYSGWLVCFSVWWNRLTDWLWKFNAQSTAVVMSGRNAGHQIASNKKSNAQTTHVQVQNYKNRVRYVSLIYASHKKSILCLIFFQCV